MSVLVNKDTRLVVQGITGSAGSFHAKLMKEYGTNLVAGVTPGKGGEKFDTDTPIYNSVHDALKHTGCNATAIYVPPHSRRTQSWKRRMLALSLSSVSLRESQ